MGTNTPTPGPGGYPAPNTAIAMTYSEAAKLAVAAVALAADGTTTATLKGKLAAAGITDPNRQTALLAVLVLDAYGVDLPARPGTF